MMKNIKNVFIVAPDHYDHSIATLVEGLNTIEDIKIFGNEPHNYIKNPISNLKTQVQIANKCDVVVLTEGALHNPHGVASLLEEIKVDVFIDECDHRNYIADPRKFWLYCKRELDLTRVKEHDNVVPLGFAAEDRFFTKGKIAHEDLWKEKTADLVCMLSIGQCPWRQDIVDTLQKAFPNHNDDKIFVGEFLQGPSLQSVDTGNRHFYQYFEKLLNARISVGAYGAGRCRQTGRLYESLANGCLVFYQPIEPFIWKNSYLNEEHFVIYESPYELVEKAMYYIEHPEEAQKIAYNGYQHLLQYHTTEARAKEFLVYCEQYVEAPQGWNKEG